MQVMLSYNHFIYTYFIAMHAGFFFICMHVCKKMSAACCVSVYMHVCLQGVCVRASAPKMKWHQRFAAFNR